MIHPSVSVNVMAMMDYLTIMTGLLLCGALYTDLLTGTIPNRLTVSFALAGLCLNMANLGIGLGAGFALKGIGTGIGLFILPWMFGMTGGGDAKLFGALGALTGSAAVFGIFLCTAMFGSLFCLHKIYQMKAAQKSGCYKQISPTIAYSGPAVLGFLAYETAGKLI